MRVYGVWEAAQPWDFAAPGRWALSTLSDVRVRQYWDPRRLVSQRLRADARPPQPEQECCTRAGTLWDLAAVYPARAMWTDRIPPAVVFNGPIIDVQDAIESAIAHGSAPQHR